MTTRVSRGLQFSFFGGGWGGERRGGGVNCAKQKACVLDVISYTSNLAADLKNKHISIINLSFCEINHSLEGSVDLLI